MPVRRTPRRRRGPGRRSSSSGTTFAVGKPSVRPRLSPSTTVALEQERRAQAAHRALDVAGRDQGADPGRGDGLAVDLDQRHDAGLELRVRRAASRGRPSPSLPKRKFSPTETRSRPSVSIRIREQNSSASIVENSWSNGITTSSSTPRPSITSRLISNGMISFGAASGWITLSGCGSKVSTVSAPSITWRWPTWTPSKVPIAISRGRCAASGRGVTVDAHRRRTLAATARSRRRERLGAARSGRVLVGLLDRERPDRGPPQLGAVGVAEVGDQAAHVGPRRALDLELGPLALVARAARTGAR